MDLSTLTRAGYLVLLKRLQGSGYTDEDDSNRVTELDSIAAMAELASAALDAATRSLFVSSAKEALDTLEDDRYLAGGDGDTDTMVARRQGRLVAFAQALPKLVEARIANAFGGYLGTLLGSTIRPDADDALAQRAPAATGLVVQRRQASIDDSLEYARRDLGSFLARGLPARALVQGVSVGDATFSSSAVAHTSIVVDPAVMPPAQTKAQAAVLDFYPGSVLEREQWIELQAMLLWKSHGFSLDQSKQGRTICVAGTISASATVLLDGPSGGSINWSHRLVSAWGTFSATSGDDVSAKAEADQVWLAPSKLGSVPDEGANIHQLVGVAGAASGGEFTVDAAGNLALINTNGATRYYHLFVRCTPLAVIGSSADSQPWVDTDAIEHDVLAEIAKSAVVDDGNLGSLFSEQRGAIRRVCYTGGLSKSAATGRVQSVVLDSSEDWRHRYVLIVPLTKSRSDTYPSASAEGVTARVATSSRPRVLYTGDGAVRGSSTALANQLADATSTPDAWIFADADTGDLVAEMKSTASTSNYVALLLLAIGSERDDASSSVSEVPLHASQIHALDLNQPQNNGCFAQGFQGGVPRYTLADGGVLGTIPTAPPLGLVTEGALPRRPVSWRVRERIGDVNDGTYEVRQKILRQRKRVVSLAVAAASSVDVEPFNVAAEVAPVGINDQADYRDRFVWIEGRFSTSDITLGNATQVSDVGSTRFSVLLYTGPYGDQEIAIGSNLSVLFSFSREGSNAGYQSKLQLKNDNDSTDYFINATIECSGYLGLTDRRMYGSHYDIFAWSDTTESQFGDLHKGLADSPRTVGGHFTGA